MAKGNIEQTEIEAPYELQEGCRCGYKNQINLV